MYKRASRFTNSDPYGVHRGRAPRDPLDRMPPSRQELLACAGEGARDEAAFMDRVQSELRAFVARGVRNPRHQADLLNHKRVRTATGRTWDAGRIVTFYHRQRVRAARRVERMAATTSVPPSLGVASPVMPTPPPRRPDPPASNPVLSPEIAAKLEGRV